MGKELFTIITCGAFPFAHLATEIEWSDAANPARPVYRFKAPNGRGARTVRSVPAYGGTVVVRGDATAAVHAAAFVPNGPTSEINRHPCYAPEWAAVMTSLVASLDVVDITKRAPVAMRTGVKGTAIGNAPRSKRAVFAALDRAVAK